MVIAQTADPASTDRTGHCVVFDARTWSDTAATGDGSGVGAGVVGTGVGAVGVAILGASAVEADGTGFDAQEAAINVAIASVIGSDIW
jgi:hypothetical protein